MRLFSPESRVGASLLEGDERLRSVQAPGEGELEEWKNPMEAAALLNHYVSWDGAMMVLLPILCFKHIRKLLQL